MSSIRDMVIEKEKAIREEIDALELKIQELHSLWSDKVNQHRAASEEHALIKRVMNAIDDKSVVATPLADCKPKVKVILSGELAATMSAVNFAYCERTDVIAGATRINTQTLWNRLYKLEKMGLVARKTVEGTRGAHWTLTSAGLDWMDDNNK